MTRNITDFYLYTGRLNRLMRRPTPMEFEIPGTGEFTGGLSLVDSENGNERKAVVHFHPSVGHIASSTFDSLMDFQLFECALESHGFTRIESTEQRRYRLEGQRS